MIMRKNRDTEHTIVLCIFKLTNEDLPRRICHAYTHMGCIHQKVCTNMITRKKRDTEHTLALGIFISQHRVFSILCGFSIWAYIFDHWLSFHTTGVLLFREFWMIATIRVFIESNNYLKCISVSRRISSSITQRICRVNGDYLATQKPCK